MSFVFKIALFICILVLVYASIQFFRMRGLIRIGTALATEAVPYEQYPKKSTQRFLVIGDSSGVGTGATETAFSTAGRLGADFPKAQIVNLSVNGSKTTDVIARLQALAGQRYDMILIQIGGNDIVRFTDVSAHEEDLRTVLSLATQLSDHVLLLHSGNVGTSHFFPYGTRFLWTRRTMLVREMYMRVAPEYDVVYIDLFREDADDPFVQENTKMYATDFFHPSDDGYAFWYEEIKKQIPKF